MKEYTFALDPTEQGAVQIVHDMHAVTTGCYRCEVASGLARLEGQHF